ncbi:MAG TPA: hypothetical protein VMU05_02760 [Dongiaceae bacterium]|nr:hypothetical protein [Dongiaceae bacterium]
MTHGESAMLSAMAEDDDIVCDESSSVNVKEFALSGTLASHAGC